MIDRATLKAIGPVHRLYRISRYLMFQPMLALATLRDRIEGDRSEEGPTPPARLRYRVHGSLDRESFHRLGRTVAANLVEILRRVDRDLDSFGQVLDFGCGCGRVLRYLKERAPASRFYGTDIDPELVAWCRLNLPGTQWSLNGHVPPLAFEDSCLDLVYAVSVFTHLDEDLQHRWLSELRRVAKPGAILILTVHGDSLLASLSPSERARAGAAGFLYLTGATGRLKLDGLPDFYQTTFHTRSYIDREWARYFEVLDCVPGAIDGYQDAVVLRRR